MAEQPSEQNAPEPQRQRLKELRHLLLHLHKALLDRERAWYEQAHGRVSSGELLQLVLNDEQFIWLRAISELIVRIDEMLDSDEPLTIVETDALITETGKLLTPSETGNEFQKKYFGAIQSEPEIVLAHREVRRLLQSDS